MRTHCPDPNLDSCANERLNDIVGSVYYVAPEVLHTSYSLEARRYMEHWSYNLHFITWKLGFRAVLRAKSRIKLEAGHGQNLDVFMQC